jgi:hypothetical protein
VGYCARDRGRSALDGQEIRSCWEPVISLRDPGPPSDDPDLLAPPDLITVEPIAAGADRYLGRFWRDAEG